MAKRGRKPKSQVDFFEDMEEKTEKIVIRRRGRKPKNEESPEVKPKKRGRKPKAKEEVKAEPKKRGRKPKVKEEIKAEPKKRGRKPKAKIEEPVAPKKRGRKPKVKTEEVVTPKKRGRKPKNVVLEQEPVVAKKRGRKPKNQSSEKADKPPVFGSKKNVDLGSRTSFEKESDKFPKFGPVQIPRAGGIGNKVVVHEENFSEICRLLRTNYGNLACAAHLCQVNISCKNRKINYGDFQDNFNILVNKYGLKDMNGRIVMMYEFDEILYKDGQARTEIGEGEDPDKDIDKEE